MFFLIPSMVLALLNQLLIFSQLYLIESLQLLTGLGLLELWDLVYPGFLTGFGMVVFFTGLSIMESQVKFIPLSKTMIRIRVKYSDLQCYPTPHPHPSTSTHLCKGVGVPIMKS